MYNYERDRGKYIRKSRLRREFEDWTTVGCLLLFILIVTTIIAFQIILPLLVMIKFIVSGVN